MNLFINDIPVMIIRATERPDKSHFNHIINATHEPITLAKLLNRVWIKHATQEDIDRLLDLLDTTSPRGLISLTLTVVDYDDIKAFIKKKFKVIKAAGGVVRKGEKVLMIYRLKKWDLPKGKLEKKEKTKEAAKREVEEECNVKVDVKNKLCTTWHTYTMKRKKVIKQTTWYNMKIVKHNNMEPQVEEDIEEVRWMTPKEVYHALQSSYKSIAFVFDEYFKARKKKQKV
ncbi:MAG: NUDIX domain-containing protein [Fulvivirga sp.]|nr:NUDIX domain-containing protein [Fulvivirga sp.]